jgi:hypothetical protein
MEDDRRTSYDVPISGYRRSLMRLPSFHSVFRGKINPGVTERRNNCMKNTVEKSAMFKKILVAAIATLLTSAMPLAFAGSASAETTIGTSNASVIIDPNATYHYNYTIENATGMGLPRSGSLDLRFGKDGIVSGYYNPGIGLSFIPVTGGLDGNSLWLDLGAKTMHLMHVDATLNPNGTINGNAFRDRSNAEYSFDATLAKS